MSEPELRATFDTDARRYDRARPSYPPELFDDLLALTGLSPGDRVLEIGPGTGKATVALAERRLRVDAVELGDNLAAVARANLAAFGDVAVHVGAFESWPLPPEPFDAVFAATAFHWIEPDVRCRKCAAALRDGGALAIVDTDHVAGGDEEFFGLVQDCYERFMPGTEAGLQLPAAAAIPDDRDEIVASGLFTAPIARRYEWEATYTTAAYLDVLRTYSGHIALEPAARDALLGCVAALIDGHFGGRIRKRYQFRLAIARKS